MLNVEANREEGKLRLLEVVRNRAKDASHQKDMPTAEAPNGKAANVLNTKQGKQEAVLYCNRALGAFEP